jgi:flagellar biosynthesis/type III secretory pathway chaperone
VTNIWDKLINILSALLTEAEELLALSKEKRLLLIDAAKAEDVESLNGITKREEILVLKINKIEKERLALVAEIAASGKLAGESLASELVKSIFQIKNLAGAEHAGRLEELGVKLKKCVDEISEWNGLNTKLISQYLEFLEFNINVLSSAACEQTYSADPQSASQVKRRALLNAKA